MFLRIASDLHTEFHTYKSPAAHNGRDFTTSMMLPIMENEKEQVLLLAGDICLAKSVPILFFRDLSERFKHIIMIAGNHESYRGNINNTTNLIKSALFNFRNITFLENEKVIIDDVLFIGSTLWTSFHADDPFDIGRSMRYAESNINDFNIIGYGPEDFPVNMLSKWTPELSTIKHNESLEFIKDSIDKNEGTNKIVVLTHHGISKKSLCVRFKGSLLNPAFFTEIDEFILKYEPNIWIHGHTHSSHRYKIGKTDVIVNPKGYGLLPSENTEYDPKLVVEI